MVVSRNLFAYSIMYTFGCFRFGPIFNSDHWSNEGWNVQATWFTLEKWWRVCRAGLDNVNDGSNDGS